MGKHDKSDSENFFINRSYAMLGLPAANTSFQLALLKQSLKAESVSGVISLYENSELVRLGVFMNLLTNINIGRWSLIL